MPPSSCGAALSRIIGERRRVLEEKNIPNGRCERLGFGPDYCLGSTNPSEHMEMCLCGKGSLYSNEGKLVGQCILKYGHKIPDDSCML